MTVKVSGAIIHLIGHAPVEDAEPLLAALHDDPARIVDLDQAAHLHSAVIQLLLALRPAIRGAPSAAFLASYVIPLLDPKEGTA